MSHRAQIRRLALCVLALQLGACVESRPVETVAPPQRVMPFDGAPPAPTLGPHHLWPAAEVPSTAPVPRVSAGNVAVAVVFVVAITLALVWFSTSSGNQGGQCPQIC